MDMKGVLMDNQIKRRVVYERRLATICGIVHRCYTIQYTVHPQYVPSVLVMRWLAVVLLVVGASYLNISYFCNFYNWMFSY